MEGELVEELVVIGREGRELWMKMGEFGVIVEEGVVEVEEVEGLGEEVGFEEKRGWIERGFWEDGEERVVLVVVEREGVGVEGGMKFGICG